MTVGYHVTVSRQGDEWRAVCPALRDHGAVMIWAEMELNGGSPPADEPVPDSVVLTFAAEGEAE